MKKLLAISIVVLGVLAVVATSALASGYPGRKVCPSFHYRGAAVHDLVAYDVPCKQAKRLTRLYYDVAKPGGRCLDSRRGLLIPGWPKWRGYCAIIGGPIVRKLSGIGVVKIHGPDFRPGVVQVR